MMKYILDSDAISTLINPESTDKEAIHQLFLSLGEKAVLSLSILTIYEFEFSIASCADSGKKERIQRVLSELKAQFSIVSLGFDDATVYGNLKARFREKTGMNQNSLKRHNLDIALASVAIANDCIIISKDKIYKEHLQSIDSRLQCLSW